MLDITSMLESKKKEKDSKGYKSLEAWGVC